MALIIILFFFKSGHEKEGLAERDDRYELTGEEKGADQLFFVFVEDVLRRCALG